MSLMRSLTVLVVVAGFLLYSAGAAAEEMEKHDAHPTGAAHEADIVNHHENHAQLKETPPNVPVLLAFGAINASFLLYGVWNMRVRNREGNPA